MSKLLLIDADTILYAAASQQQSNQCLATNTQYKTQRLFESKTTFNEWVKITPDRTKDMYSFETISEVTGEPRFAFQTIKQKIDTIVEASGCKDYRVCIQGEGNFRKFYESKFVDYKGQRTAKPLLFAECFDYMEKKYKSKCVVSVGQETDDYVNIQAWDALRLNTSESLVVAYVDKDITANGQGQYLNYNKLDKGVFWQDEKGQYLEYWTQVIVGDSADNLMGLEVIHKETKEKYGIKTNGAGPVAATKLLAGVTSEKEAAERVIEAYSLSWPEDWEQRISDNAFFLYLRRKEGEMFNFKEYVEGLV
jgi:hypothetical protein